MNTCLEEGLLQAYMDGELAGARAEAVSAHLAACATCAELAHEAEHEYALVSTAFAPVLDTPAPTERLRARMDAPTLGEEFFALLSRRGLDAPPDEASLTDAERRARYQGRVRAVLEVVTHFETRFEEYQLSEALIAHDEFFSLWRYHHVKMVERMLGTKKGTGGSEGVGYLKTTLDKKFFPELWEARTHLDSTHGAAGCPFAGR